MTGAPSRAVRAARVIRVARASWFPLAAVLLVLSAGPAVAAAAPTAASARPSSVAPASAGPSSAEPASVEPMSGDVAFAGKAPAGRAPVERCTVQTPELAELSGLAADGEHWYATGDGGTQLEVFELGPDCAVQRVLTNPTDPYDVEDLALARDGTLWLADSGDNSLRRTTVALHALSTDGSATLHRLTYPDGPRDAEALLLDRHSTPYLVTKSPLGDAEVYRPAAPLATPGPTPLERVGTMSLRSTTTPGGPIANSIGSTLVTGGAVSPDGRVVALRTYTDAYLYPAPDGDIPAALSRKPVHIPLANEPQGEAIAFTPDGTLLSASEARSASSGSNEPIRAVPNAARLVLPPAPPPQRDTSGSGSGAPGDKTAAHAADDTESLSAMPLTAIGIGVALVALVLLALARARRRARDSR